MRRSHVTLRSAWPAIVLASVLSACSMQVRLDDLGEAAGGDPAVAARIVDQWFELARSGERDSGWWLLYPNVRTEFIGSLDEYRDALARVDWAALDHEVVGSQLHDGHYHVDVRIAGGRPKVPEPMCRWGLIQFVPGNGALVEAGRITVRIPPLGGESGILGGAGC